MSRFCLFLIFVFIAPSVFAQDEYEYDQAIRDSYNSILHLRFDKAATSLDLVRRNNPSNVLPDFYDYHILFLKTFIAEEDQYFEKLQNVSKVVLERLKVASESPYKRHIQADVLMQRALARSKFHQYFRAAIDLNKANRLLEQNKRYYPDFGYSDKGLGLIHAFFGTLSGFQKGLVSFFTSIDADIDKGLEEINSIARSVDNGSLQLIEILLAQTMIALHVEKDAEKAWKIIQNEALPPESPIVVFFRASIALQIGRNGEGIDILSEYTPDTDSFPFYYLRYMYGASLLNQLSPYAEEPILAYIEKFKGKTYLKEACQKMAWYHLVIKDDQKGYEYWIDKIGNVGTTIVGEDSSAAEESQKSGAPNRSLLKARLLFDGGQYRKSLEVLNQNQHLADHDDYALEYYYRLGRNRESIGDYVKARINYKKVILDESSMSAFFKCNAALRMGIISEELGLKEDSKKYYEMCLHIHPPYFSKSLHQKAKFGLRRIRKGDC